MQPPHRPVAGTYCTTFEDIDYGVREHELQCSVIMLVESNWTFREKNDRQHLIGQAVLKLIGSIIKWADDI